MILQEYLVKLGWNVDEPSMKKFLGAVAATGAHTSELGAVAIETAAAIELMVSRVARKYETLYYVSQRTNKSVQYLQSTSFAFKQIGLSAEDAQHNIENIAATIRTQPWLKAIFGGESTPQGIAKRLGNSGLPYFLQTKFAEMIGMDEKTLFHLQRFGEVEAAAQANFARRQKEAGIDPETLAKQSANFGREVNKLESSLELLGDKMAINFLGPVNSSIHRLSELTDWFLRVDTATKGWATTLATLAGTAGGLFVVERIVRRILGLNKATATGGLLRGAGGLFRGGWAGAAAAGLLTVKQNDPAQKKALQETLGPLLYELGLSKSPNLNSDPGLNNATNKAKAAAEFFKNAGFPADSANGIAAGLYSESKLDPTSVNGASGATGIAQWLGSRQSKFKEMFNKDLGEATFEEQLQYVLWELTKGGEQATGKRLAKGGLGGRGAASAFISGYERPGPAGEISDMSRAGPLADALSGLTPNGGGGAGATITLKSDVHVHGAFPDPVAAANEFKKSNDASLALAIRNSGVTTR